MQAEPQGLEQVGQEQVGLEAEPQGLDRSERGSTPFRDACHTDMGDGDAPALDAPLDEEAQSIARLECSTMSPGAFERVAVFAGPSCVSLLNNAVPVKRVTTATSPSAGSVD